MASTYLTRAATGSVTSDKIFTMSVWLKRSSITASGSSDHWFMHENASGHTQKLDLHFCDDEFRMGWWDGSSEYNLDSKMKFRDTNAWYHIVFRCDTTQATASNRVRVYVNGEQIELQQIGGGSPDAQQPAQNATMNLGQKIICIGRYQSSNPGQYFNGCMSHLHYCDGQSYAPTEFGETDSTTGEWKIKNDPSLTYGNNGFWLFKNDNAVTNRAAGTSSGNFSVAGGTLTKTEDNPSNVFATFNPLWSASNGNIGDVTFSNGNTTTTTSASYRTTPTTLGMKSGKYYWEIKRNEDDGNDLHGGVMSENATPANTATWIGNAANGWIISGDGGNPYTGGTSGSVISNAAFPNAGDIHMCAYDGSTGKLYFGANGTWGGTANPSTGANPHYTLDNSLIYFPCVSTGSDCSANFGNGYFGTTAVSSAGTNASGIGIFEYDVPTGYTALSTKGLNE